MKCKGEKNMKKGLTAVLSLLSGVVAGAVGIGYIKGKQIKQKTEKVDKFRNYYNILNQWLLLKQEGRSIEKWFLDKGYKTIAIYGMGELGNRLYNDLKNTSVIVKYAIDKNTQGSEADIDIVDLDDYFEEVDVVIVTATFAFFEVCKDLDGKINSPIISLEDVVFEI
jgi:lactate dehydrogenase-like 2-hydroxyacid dehydrogenase